MSAEAKNLEAITKAIVQHNGNCEYPVIEIQMCAYEVERLGWDEIRGIPVVPTDTLPEGRFRLVCDKPQDTSRGPVIGKVVEVDDDDRVTVEIGGPPSIEALQRVFEGPQPGERTWDLTRRDR